MFNPRLAKLPTDSRASLLTPSLVIVALSTRRPPPKPPPSGYGSGRRRARVLSPEPRCLRSRPGLSP